MGIRDGQILAIRQRVPRGARTINLHDAYLASGFIDLHVWGEPDQVARDAVRHGTTAFLATLGPEPPTRWLERVSARSRAAEVSDGAACLGLHLEGPFVNPARAGALPRRWMRPPTEREIERLARAAGGWIKLITMAPELPGAAAAIRWWTRRGAVVSLGHSVASAESARRGVEAGARAVTHVFNGMPRLDPRCPSLLDVALTDPRLTAMVINDGVHVSPAAFRLLVRAKGASGVALVTDSIRHQPGGARLRGGAYYTAGGVLAGSRLTMIRAVENAMVFGPVPLTEAVRMATEVPARLLGLRGRGRLAVGARADLVAFDSRFRVVLTVVGGRIAYTR